MVEIHPLLEVVDAKARHSLWLKLVPARLAHVLVAGFAVASLSH
jgi:hypothetical protein